MSANQTTSIAFWLIAVAALGAGLQATTSLADAQEDGLAPADTMEAASDAQTPPKLALPPGTAVASDAPNYPSTPTAQKQPRAPLNVAHAGSVDDPYTWAGQDAIRAKMVGRQHTPSPLLLPDQQLPIRFSHKAHLAEDMSCTDCHSMVVDSVRASDVNLPPEATCFDCHYPNDARPDPAEADPAAACETCHPGYSGDFPPDVDDFEETHRALVAPPDVIIPPPNIKFNHKIHLDEGVECKVCHGTMEDIDLATRENSLPTMGTCLTCHDNKQASFRCETCHLTNPDGRMKTEFGGEKLVPAGWYMGDAHDEAFLKNHKHAAQMNDGYCENCHEPKFCMDCHNGVQKPLKIHPNNWILTHATAARKYSPNCSSCHRQQSFCVDCHQRTKVAWEPRGQGAANLQAQGIKFHPEGWADFTGRGPNHHAFQAQRNINACASCHTEQSCLTCHSTTTANVNPHPPGFAGSTACKGMYRRNHRACTKCHTPTDPKLQLCR